MLNHEMPRMSMKPDGNVILPKPQESNTFLTPNPNMEKESASPATSGGITPSNLKKNEANEAPVQGHGIKKINIRTKFMKNPAKKANLEGTLFAPDPSMKFGNEENKLDEKQKEVTKEVENPFPEKENNSKNPFLKSDSESFIVPPSDVHDVSTPGHKPENAMPHTIEVEESMSPEKAPYAPLKLH